MTSRHIQSSTGFQSQAHDYFEPVISLSHILDLNKPGIYPVRVEGAGFEARGIRPDDILIVDTSAQLRHDALAVVFANNEVSLARLEKNGQSWCMQTDHGQMIFMNAEIWGVVTGLVRETV